MTKYVGLGWNVTRVSDANDLTMLGRAYETFLKTNDRPTLIVVDSHIGYGSPNKHDSSDSHGEPLGVEEVKLTKKAYGWPEDAQFLVPDGVYDRFKNGIGKRGGENHAAWRMVYNEYKTKYPELDQQLQTMKKWELPKGWDKDLPNFPADAKGLATRDSSNKVLNALAKNIPWFLGGSADLAHSNKTNLTFEGAGDFFPEDAYKGRNLHFGVREHAMGAAVNGLSVSRLRAFGATFFNFSDYMKPAMRIAALEETPSMFIFTHDSIGLGEDGPTHQPIEQLAGLRAMPNMMVLRPGDANEVVECYKLMVQSRHTPSTLVLTRQAMPTFDRTKFAPASGVAKGAYVLIDADGGKPDVILMGTGSEVHMCVEAREKLAAEGIKARVVSMPSWYLFEKQDDSYKESVLPAAITARVSVEMAATFGWDRYVGPKGKMIGMHSFGASAPIKDVMKKFGFTVENIVAAAKQTVGK
jgi:transketolase